MKHEMTVTANLHEPDLLVSVVEKLASRHVDRGFKETAVLEQWKPIESSCIQAYVLGSFDMQTANNNSEETVNVPFAGCFLFTCLKGDYGLFNLEWSASLS